MNTVLDIEDNRMLTLEQGRELIKNTSLSEITDEELKELLETIKIFCEINFDLHLNNAAQNKILQLDPNSTDEKTGSDKSDLKKAA
jgi:hypothetical protein